MFSNDIHLIVQCILKFVYFYIQYKWEKTHFSCHFKCSGFSVQFFFFSSDPFKH